MTCLPQNLEQKVDFLELSVKKNIKNILKIYDINYKITLKNQILQIKKIKNINLLQIKHKSISLIFKKFI